MIHGPVLRLGAGRLFARRGDLLAPAPLREPARPVNLAQGLPLVLPRMRSIFAIMPSRRAVHLAFPALCAALLLSGCGGAEAKLRNGLIAAGLSERFATCIAKPMADKLSIGQLRKLESLARTAGLDPRRTTYEQLLRHIRALGDPEILQVTASAALGCALEI